MRLTPMRWFVLTMLMAACCGAPARAGSTISTVAGTGAPGESGDGGAAIDAMLNAPAGVAIDADGNLFIADQSNHKIRKIDAATGVIDTIAGTGQGGDSGDGGAATAAKLKSPAGVALDADGNVYVADQDNHKIRRIDAATGVIDTIAGTGQVGSSGDGGSATDAKLKSPAGVAVDDVGNVYIADQGNHKIRKIDAATGIIGTIAGTGAVGSSGDGGPATSAKFKLPACVVVDTDGNICIADQGNHKIRRIDATTGVIDTVAGTGQPGDLGDGGAATAAELNAPTGVAVDPDGNVYVADTSNDKIRRIDAASGFIATFAGTGVPGDSGDDGPARAAQLKSPVCAAVVYDADEEITTVFIADQGNHKIRKVLTAGVTIVRWREIDPVD